MPPPEAGHQHYGVKQLIQLQACTGCRICAEVCPAVQASSDGQLSALYRLAGLSRMLRSRSGILHWLFRRCSLDPAQLKPFSDTVFRCTLCANCQEACPVGIQLKALWLALRQDLVHCRQYPDKIATIRENLAQSRNVFAEDNQERADWVQDLPEAPEHGHLKDRAEVVYFTGCVAAYFPRAQKIPVALARIMAVAGVDFTLLGSQEWCCGFPMLGAGLGEMFSEFREHNLAAVRQKGAYKVVFACPTCYQTWREYYPPEFELIHAAEFLMQLVKQGRVSFEHLEMTVTYHDPCDLGRGARVFDEPRAVIQSIPGIHLVELEQNREQCTCCGGGGNLEMIDAGLGAQIAKHKIEEILVTGAQAVITSCQQCVRTMMTHVRRHRVALEVMDISELVYRAMRR